jgi:mono/diheme cytochrome c family protein
MIKRIAGVCVVVLLAIGVGTAQTRASEPTQQLLDSFKGPKLFRAYCAACHGKDAKGGGPVAGSLKVAPADLTRIAERNGGKFPFLTVQKIISGEQQLPAIHGTHEMPVWGPLFSEVSWDQDLGRLRIYSLAKYLETIQAK